ncbi:MAG: hypothetical protein HKN18_18360, partial [Silicimonas sp.]|nr:hypothetical protein [Silicimonas sp.]
MARLLWHGAIVAGLTALTQIGGLAWLVALALTVRKGAISFILVFLVLYGATWGTARATAPVFGRVAISCTSNGAGPKTFNLFYCVLNRAYVTPELAALLQDLAVHLQSRHPGARVLVLDGGFPFFDGFPLLPHLSHSDGRKVDLALWYQNGAKRSPLGYWAFEAPTPGASRPCAGVAGLSMRWSMAWLQPLMRDAPMD